MYQYMFSAKTIDKLNLNLTYLQLYVNTGKCFTLYV